MTPRSLSARCQWHQEVCLPDANDTKESVWQMPMTPRSLSARCQWHQEVCLPVAEDNKKSVCQLPKTTRSLTFQWLSIAPQSPNFLTYNFDISSKYRGTVVNWKQIEKIWLSISQLACIQDSLRKEKSNDKKSIRLREVRVFNIYDRISPQDWYLQY